MVIDLVAALAMASGVLMEPAALALAVYCGVTSLLHFLPDDPWQMTIFVKNLAVAGGCLILAASGGGTWRLRLIQST